MSINNIQNECIFMKLIEFGNCDFVWIGMHFKISYHIDYCIYLSEA